MTGSTIDTNSVFLSRQLLKLGVEVIGKSTVGDDALYLQHAFETAVTHADLVICSGGLGPTGDDLTKEMVCRLMKCQPILVEEELQRLQEFFRRRGYEMPESNRKQAMFPGEAVILPNKQGTAPGMYLKKDGKLIILLPGPPREMQAMYNGEVRKRLIAEYGSDETMPLSRTLRVFGPGESWLADTLPELLQEWPECQLAYTAEDGEIAIKVSIEGEDAAAVLESIRMKMQSALGKNIVSDENETLAAKVHHLLYTKKKTIALAESCTGGLTAKMLTDFAGSSEYLWGSVVSYSNHAKRILLQVKEETLGTYGAVSSQTAEEMARGVIAVSGADIGVSITGIAGPGGGTENKPVGLVYIAVCHQGRCSVRELHFAGPREFIRILSAKTALDRVRRLLEYEEEHRS